MQPTRPAGSIGFAAAVEVEVSAAALCALAVDLPAYVRAEPRLREARWLDGAGPAVGARAEIVAEIPVSLSIMDRVIGPPRGIATLEELIPGERVAYSLRTPQAHGRLCADFEERGATTLVSARGWICPRSLAGGLTLRPAAPLLSHLLNRAVTRAVARAAATLS